MACCAGLPDEVPEILPSRGEPTKGNSYVMAGQIEQMLPLRLPISASYAIRLLHAHHSFVCRLNICYVPPI